MSWMFDVRSSPCPALSQQSSAPVTLLGAPRSQRAARLPARDSPCTVCALHSTRQVALSFNQPVTFDTSKVTNMLTMFQVRSSPYLQSSLPCPPPLHAACPAVARRLPPSGPQPAPHSMPSFRLSAQSTIALNQPLTFDTSSVTNMQSMFYVRSSPCPAPNLHSSPPICGAPRLSPPSGPQLARHRMLPSLRPGRTRNLCPPPTSCSSAARGRAPRPSPPLDMARAGLREAAQPRRRPKDCIAREMASVFTTHEFDRG